MMRSADRLYRLHIGIAALAAATVVAAGAIVLAGSRPAFPSTAAIATACQDWLSAGGFAALLGVALVALPATVLGLGVRSALGQVRAGGRYLSSQTVVEDRMVQGTRCGVTDAEDPEAFCAGYVHPRVYLSRGALDRLSPGELQAVLAHERHHLRRRDPLRRLVARAAADALFFVPVLGRISDRHAALGEIAADEAAVSNLGDRRSLASALLKFSEREPAPAAVAGIDPERVDHLLGDPGAGRWQLPPLLLGRSVLVLAILGTLVLLLWNGIVDPTLESPVLLAGACMAAMVGGPIALAAAALVVSRRALRARRA